ncbi:MAG: recombinase family protein [bacterium]|nr:recombinase family protein [bacterium]
MKKKLSDIERPKVALIYVRVSSDEQVLGYSLSSQERLNREMCKKEGWEAMKVFRDDGASAKNADRPQLKLMQEFCLRNPGKIGYIVVWKIDRFARSLVDHYMLRSFFSQLGIELRSTTEGIGDNPIGKATEGMAAIMAQYENDIKSQRTITGMTAKALDGRWPVGAPWGYKNIKDALGKKIIVPDPERAPIVKFLFEEYARGTITFIELSKKVNEMGDVRSKHGCKMSKQLVHKILKNPIHYGWIEMPQLEVSVQGRHEAIISKELFYEVQFLMEGGKSRKQPRNRNNPLFPLKGLLCGGCGGSLTGGKTNGRNRKYDYYSCMKKSCPKRISIKKENLEDDFTEFVGEITPDPIVLDALEEALTIVHQKQNKDNLLLANSLEKKLVEFNKELDELLKMRVQREITPEEYSRVSTRLKIEQREIEMQRNSLVSPEESTEAAVSFGIRLIKEFPTCWPMLEPGELKVLRKLFFPKNLEYQYPKFKTAELAPIYNTKSQSYAQENHFVTLPGIGPGF